MIELRKRRLPSKVLHMPFDVEALAAETLVDPDGKPHRLGDVWADQTHLVLFLRHFG